MHPKGDLEWHIVILNYLKQNLVHMEEMFFRPHPQKQKPNK